MPATPRGVPIGSSPEPIPVTISKSRGGANFAFCDGHAKFSKRGALKDENFDVRCQPGIGCAGKSSVPNPADYPAISDSCNGQSGLNCR